MALTDPAGKIGCDELCRTPETASGLDLYLNCRIHCLLPDFAGLGEGGWFALLLTFGAGLRRELDCGESEKYFARVHACVSLEAASSPEFIKAFSEIKYCQGNRVIRTKEDVESLRYCDHIRGGGLVIEVADASADFYAMNDIDTIEGRP
jgi:hypothetical protein